MPIQVYLMYRPLDKRLFVEYYQISYENIFTKAVRDEMNRFQSVKEYFINYKVMGILLFAFSSQAVLS